MSVTPWFAQPDRVVGTAIALPGRTGGIATPLMHWSAAALTRVGWSVLGLAWDDEALADPGETAVRRRVESVLDEVDRGRPVLVLAKSLGTYALGWAVEHDLPGVWLTPVLTDPGVAAAAARADRPTLLVGGTADPLWRVPTRLGPGVEVVELPGADHGLQVPDWRASLAGQLPVFDRIVGFATRIAAGDDHRSISTDELLTRFAAAIDEHRWDDLADLLHPDFRCDYVHTGESFDRDAWVAFNRAYPGFQRFVLRDSVTTPTRAVARAHVTGLTDGQESHFEVASFVTVRDGLVAELTEVWTDVDAAPPVRPG